MMDQTFTENKGTHPILTLMIDLDVAFGSAFLASCYGLLVLL
jgi:hypothetical protein